MHNPIVETLGSSPFNYRVEDITDARMIHYGQQFRLVMHYKPQRVLEIGPGTHTITDMLRRQGVTVDTFDNDAALKPDHLGDMREPLALPEQFDLVLAAEVFEHMNFRFLPRVLEHIKAVLVQGGYLVVGLPFSTIRLFPPRRDFGWPVSCEGRLQTHLSFAFAQRCLGLLRGTLTPRQIIPEYPDDRFDTHHWDVGYYPTTQPLVRHLMAQHFTLVREDRYYQDNSIFWVLQKT